tara:strand:+ start:1499 stop:1642 length:144 start_codon:yes stop_codon:yes gene_type:complete
MKPPQIAGRFSYGIPAAAPYRVGDCEQGLHAIVSDQHHYRFAIGFQR